MLEVTEIFRLVIVAIVAAYWQEIRLRQKRLEKARSDLGSRSASTRMDAVQELIQLAREYKTSIQRWVDFLLVRKKGNLPQRVMNILCFHICQKTSGNKYRQKHKNRPSAEIQEMLTLIFVDKNNGVFEDCRINLQYSFLSGAILANARLKKTNLFRAQLQNAILDNAQMQRAILCSANLKNAYFYGTQMQGVNLDDAQVPLGEFYNTSLQGANFDGTTLYWATFSNANLQGATLKITQMQGCSIIDSDMRGAEIEGAEMQETNLRRVKMQGVSRVDMSRTKKNFENRIKSRAGKNSELTGITFTGGLSKEKFDRIINELHEEHEDDLLANCFRAERLSKHIDKLPSHELPDRSEVIIEPPYTEAEAEQWIKEYREAIQGFDKS